MIHFAVRVIPFSSARAFVQRERHASAIFILKYDIHKTPHSQGLQTSPPADFGKLILFLFVRLNRLNLFPFVCTFFCDRISVVFFGATQQKLNKQILKKRNRKNSQTNFVWELLRKCLKFLEELWRIRLFNGFAFVMKKWNSQCDSGQTRQWEDSVCKACANKWERVQIQPRTKFSPAILSRPRLTIGPHPTRDYRQIFLNNDNTTGFLFFSLSLPFQ